MVTRRNFLGAATGAAGATFFVGMMPKVSWSLTQGGGIETWAALSDTLLLAKTWVARFTNVLPNPLSPTLLGIGFVYRPDVGTTNKYTVTAGETAWQILGPASAGFPATRVFGYGNYEGVASGVSVTYPGRTFVVQRGVPINVDWVNNLAAPVLNGGAPMLDASGNVVTDGSLPVSQLVGVDQTISMQTDQSVATLIGDNVTYSGPEIIGVPMAVHHHGGDSNREFDGGPDQWHTPRRVQAGPGVSPPNSGNSGSDRLQYTYDNTQEASIHWYHDHAEGVTRINAYAGMAGLYVVRDANEAALIRRGDIPSGAYELPLVIQDKTFTATGALAYAGNPADYPVPGLTLQSPTHMPEMFGDVAVVNGVAWPNCPVEPREYRLRLLNGSDSRFYKLQFGYGGLARRGGYNNYLDIYKIATDLGFLNTPVAMPAKTVLIGPGERMDIVVDFSKAQPVSNTARNTVVMVNTAAAPYSPGAVVNVPIAGAMGIGTIMQFDVSLPVNTAVPLSRVTKLQNNLKLRGLAADTPLLVTRPRIAAGTPVRRILLAEGVDEFGRIMPQLGSFQMPGDPAYANYPGQSNLGTLAFTQLPSETPTMGQDEIWELWNNTVDSHPIHIHLSQFRILEREAFAPTLNAPIDPVTGLQVMTEVKDMINGWTGTRLLPQYVQLSGLIMRAPADEQGWKDTVVTNPGTVTRVYMSFKRRGKYVMHCHILSHEEHDMMRWFEVK